MKDFNIKCFHICKDALVNLKIITFNIYENQSDSLLEAFLCKYLFK